MARRITVKKILSGIPNITKLTGFSDVNDSGLSETNGFLRYDSDNQNFKFVSLASLGVQSVNSITGSVTITGASGVSVNTSGDTITLTGAVDSASVNALIDARDTHDSAAVQAQIDSNLNALDTHDSAAVQGQITSTINASYINALTIDADTLGGNDSAYYLNYNNFTNTPTIPTVDSASIRPLARSAISAGTNITYDSATGVIGTVGTDSATVVLIADSRIGVASIGDLSNVDLTGLVDGRILKYSSSSGKFIVAADATDSGGGVSTADLVVVDSSPFGSLSYNGSSGVFTYVGVDSDDIKTVTNIPYANLTGTPTIPTVDSATIKPLARAAIVAGTNITYDSATGVIASTASGGVDSAAINTLIAAADTHDSVLVQGQIDSNFANDVTLGGTLSLGDNQNINIGAGNDLQLYHTGSHSFIKDAGTGSLFIDGTVFIRAGSGNKYFSGEANVAKLFHTNNEKLATTATGIDVTGNIVTTGYLAGPAVFTIDPAGVGDSTGKVIILGDLQVDGTTTTINSTTVSISDKNIVLADSAADSSQANGAGITVNAANAKLTYTSADDRWTFNKAPYYNTNRLLTDADTLVDSAIIRPLARAAIVQGDNISYDSSTGVISADIGDTHDSAAVSGQINNEVDQNFLQNRIRFDNNKPLRFGDDSDFTIVHNGSHTVLLDKGTGSLFIEGSQIHLASQNNGNPIFLTTGDGDGVKVFDSTGDLRLHARDTGIHTYTGLFVDGNSVLTTTNATSYLKSDEKDQKTAGSLVFNDGIALKFGTDSDHSIAEGSGNLEINTAGTSLLKINTAGLRIHNAAGTENLLQASQDGAVTLYYDNAQKAITRSDGFEVTGHLISDSVQTTHIDIFGEVTHKPTPQNAGAGQTTVKSLPHNNVPCSITYNVHMKDINGTTTKGETSFTTIVCTLDSDLDTSFTEFATLFTGDSEFGTFVVEADATNIDLKFTRRSTRDGTIRVAAAKTVVL